MSIEECYTLKEYKYKDGFFSKHINATYIIYLSGSSRMTNIMSQLEKYHPTDTVYVLINKPFKYCDKKIFKKSIAYDIIDANIYIFNHAKQNNYSNILVLEDDFVFSSEITNKIHINNINSFINDHSDTDFVYQLGCAPILSIPYNSYTFITFSGGAHANIYSHKAYIRYIDEYNKNSMDSFTYISGLDSYIAFDNYKWINLYMYYKPLCYQIYPLTDSRKEWNYSLATFGISLLGIDKNPEPGTSILYFLSKLLFIIIIIFVFIIIRFILKSFNILKSYKSITKFIRVSLTSRSSHQS